MENSFTPAATGDLIDSRDFPSTTLGVGGAAV